MYLDLGDTYTLAFTLLSPQGVAANADAMILTISLPDGTAESHTVTPTTTGHYSYNYTAVQVGRHVASWLGTGTNFGAYAEAFEVTGPTIESLISLASARAQLNDSNAADDDEIRSFLEAVTVVIERVTGRTIILTTRTERCRCVGGEAVLALAPVITVSAAVAADGSWTWTPGADLDWTDDGLVGTNTGAAPLHGYVDFTYTAGMRVVPASYLLAARFLLQHLWETKRGSGGPPSPGALNDEVYTPGVAFAVPYRVLELLGSPRSGIA